MLAAFFRFLSTPTHYQRSEQRAAQTLNAMLIIQGVAVLGIFLYFVVTDPTSIQRPSVAAIGIDLIVYVGAKLLLNHGQLRFSAILMIVVQALNLAGAILLESGIRDMKAAAFIGLIAMSSLVLGRRDTIMIGILTILLSSIIFLAEISGLRPAPVNDTVTISDLAVLLSVLAVMIILMTLATRSINQAFSSIRSNELRIRRDNQLLSEEIAIHTAAEEKLLTLNKSLAASQSNLEATVLKRTEALATINNDLETLLQVTSLDLKQPLAIIRANSELALQDPTNTLSAKADDYLRRVSRAAKRMEMLLNDVIKLSEVKQLDTVTKATDLNSIVAAIQERLEAQIEESQASIQVEGSLPRLNVDELWVSEALFNLISNALKYCLPGERPEILITKYKDETGSGVAVMDRGPGVAAEYRERIFELFKRTVNRDVAGTGAGLAIVQQIAKRHGGRTWVEPRPGGGSSFYITFGPGAEVQTA